MENNPEQQFEKYDAGNEPRDLSELEEFRLEQIARNCGDCQELFMDRNRAYGDSISATGMLGAVVTLVGDTGRLRRMVLPKINVELLDYPRIIDTLRDIHNYSAIALMMLEDENLVGK